MIEDFVCPSCQKKHESEEPVCEFCGQDLKEAIITYKKKIEPLQFYKEIKKGQKKREKVHIKSFVRDGKFRLFYIPVNPIF